MRFWLTAACVLTIGGCHRHDAAAAPANNPSSKPQTQENTMDNGARSPTGEAHPGQIVHDDKVDGRTWTAAAADVPRTIAWVDVNGTWKAVVRIEITGTSEQRRITKFGTDGQMLETTIQAPPAPRPPAPR
jgi:hypothetical protein